MYTRYKFSFKDLVVWTRRELAGFVLLSIVFTGLYHVAGCRWLQIPWTPIALVGTAVAFLIGFQNNAAYGRAWEARTIWGGIVNISRSWAILVRDMVNNAHANDPVSKEELASIHTTLIHRHLAWITALRHAMRAQKSWEMFAKRSTTREWYLTACIPERDYTLEDEIRPFLSPDEYEKVLKATNRPAAVMALQSQHLRQLKDRRLIWEFAFLDLAKMIKESIELQGKSERIKNFPYPRQYATLGYDLVKIFVLFLPLGVIPEFANLGEELTLSHPTIGPYFVWLAVPFSTIVSWIFSTMQRIGTTGENPFEGSANDVPISTMARGIEIDLREINGESASEIPDPLCEVYNIQM